MQVIAPDAVFLELITREVPEGASQTFKMGSPLKLGSGLAVEFVNPTDALLAYFSEEDGHNDTGSTIKVIRATPHIEIEGNFLADAAENNVLAAGDLGAQFDIDVSTTLIGGATRGWYITDTTTDPVVRICSFPAVTGEANSAQSTTIAGDTNARVRAVPISSKLLWTAVD
jgi:hypothetical protein